MTAQIIEFPMHRVRRPVQSARNTRAVQPVYQVRTSVKVARAVIFWSLVFGVVYGLFFSSGSNMGSAEASNDKVISSSSTDFTYITVMSGDTLWSLAERYAPNRDPRDFIYDLVSLNNLNDSVLSSGMRLALPQN